jgi:hypothetical protein
MEEKKAKKMKVTKKTTTRNGRQGSRLADALRLEGLYDVKLSITVP